jgi:hypothetical protein
VKADSASGGIGPPKFKSQSYGAATGNQSPGRLATAGRNGVAQGLLTWAMTSAIYFFHLVVRT